MKDDVLRAWTWRILLAASVVFWGGFIVIMTSII
nr:MAG TPA: hypothetical protein [Caudoviricetes sp.]